MGETQEPFVNIKALAFKFDQKEGRALVTKSNCIEMVIIYSLNSLKNIRLTSV